MRTLVVVVVALIVSGCNEHGQGGAVFCLHNGQVFEPGELFSAGDGCNFCSCESNGDVTCSSDSCGDGGGIPDAGIDQCAPDEGICGNAIECNGLCCNPGEQCVFGACSCGGTGVPCVAGDICFGFGDVPAGRSCGAICCGQSGPCPD